MKAPRCRCSSVSRRRPDPLSFLGLPFRPDPTNDPRPVEHEHRSLLLILAANGPAQPTVARDCDAAVERADKRGARGLLMLLRQLLTLLDLDPARFRERLDGLNATHRRARDDSLEVVLSQQADELTGLTQAARVERPQPIVSLPLVALAGAGMADEQD